MAPLSKLTLTSYRRTQPNQDPIEERRSKTEVVLDFGPVCSRFKMDQWFI